MFHVLVYCSVLNPYSAMFPSFSLMKVFGPQEVAEEDEIKEIEGRTWNVFRKLADF
jgi:hypothetical protein